MFVYLFRERVHAGRGQERESQAGSMQSAQSLSQVPQGKEPLKKKIHTPGLPALSLYPRLSHPALLQPRSPPSFQQRPRNTLKVTPSHRHNQRLTRMSSKECSFLLPSPPLHPTAPPWSWHHMGGRRRQGKPQICSSPQC